MVYLRIFQDKTSKNLIFGMMAFVVITWIPAEILVTFQCSPLSGVWEFGGEAKCINLKPELIFFATCSILSDVGLIAFAVPRVCKFCRAFFLLSTSSLL
jgi:hypothetical protein